MKNFFKKETTFPLFLVINGLLVVMVFIGISVFNIPEVNAGGVAECSYGISEDYTNMGCSWKCSTGSFKTTGWTWKDSGYVSGVPGQYWYCDDFSDCSGNKPNRICRACRPNWTAWSACSATCDGGTQTRTDGCGGSQSQPCNTQACFEPCVYAEVTGWGSCQDDGFKYPIVEWLTNNDIDASDPACTGDSTTPIACSVDGQCDNTTIGEVYEISPTQDYCSEGIEPDLESISGPTDESVYSWTCEGIGDEGESNICATQPAVPTPGKCGSADEKYYPEESNINSSNLCANGTTATAITPNEDGTFSWDCQGLYYLTEEARELNDAECNTVPNSADQLTCRFEPFDNLDSIELEDDLRVKAYVDPVLDITGLKYKFVKDELDFKPLNGLIRIGGANYNDIYNTIPYIDLELKSHGVYQTKAYLQYFEVDNFASDMCEGNFGDYFVSIGLPEISFSIDPELANEDNKCNAEISISNNVNDTSVQCKILTENNETFNQDLELTNGFNEEKEVTAGTSYKLKCELADTLYADLANDAINALLETPTDRCVTNPNLRQN